MSVSLCVHLDEQEATKKAPYLRGPPSLHASFAVGNFFPRNRHANTILISILGKALQPTTQSYSIRLYTSSFNLHNCKKINPINPPDTAAGRLKMRKILIRRICKPSQRKKHIRKKEEMKRIVVLPDDPCGTPSVWRTLVFIIDIKLAVDDVLSIISMLALSSDTKDRIY